MQKPSSAGVSTFLERDVTQQQQSRHPDVHRARDSHNPPPALPDTRGKQGPYPTDASYAPAGPGNIQTLVRDTETQDGSARHGPAHVRPDDTKRLITITTLALAVVCAFTILSLLLPSTRPQGDVSRWCDTSDCRDFAALLTRELNRSVDPCHDFDAYVCSTWKPDDRFPLVFQTALDDLSIAWLDGLPELLEEGAKAASLAAKPLAMYSACVENSGVSVADRGWFLEFLRARKLSWPDRPRGGVRVSSVLVDLSMNWEMSLWMRVRVLKHPFTPRARRFLFLPGRRSDVRLFAALHKHVMSTGDYARYWGLIYHYFLGRQPGPEYEMTIKKSAESQGDAVAILIQMAMLRSYTNASLIRISDASSTQGPADMWLEALRENAQSMTAGDDVLVANTAALFIVRDYVERHGDDGALMHLSWQFIQMYALALDKTLLEGVLGNGTYAANYLALLCAAQVEAVYNPVLAELYVPSRLTRKGETLADTLFGTLKQKAIDGVSRMSWLDGDAREFFKQQLASTVVRLWPSATMKNVLEVEEVYAGCPQGERSFVRFWISSRRCLSELLKGKRREDVSSMQPNFTPYLASYDSFENAVGIAVSALASPLYWMRGTPSMLYGGLGWFFTAFLLSPLDEHKQYVHPNGSFDVTGSWLSAQSAEALKQKKDCAAPARVSAIVGLEIVHSVFMKHLRNSFQFNLTSELTEEKVFFMMLCRMLCAKKGSIWSLASCNGLVKHSKEFSRAFKCDASSTLIARKECQLLSP